MENEDKFPLHTAAREGRVPTAEALLKVSIQISDTETRCSFVRQSDPKLSQRKDDDGRYPIHWAASSNNLEIVQLLASQRSFDADIQDESGWSPLMISASVPDGEAVLRLIISKDADVNLKNSAGQTALHFVASKNNLDIARVLIDNGASTRIRDRRGQYPLHRAAAIGSVPMVNILLKNKSPLNPTDNEGYTPLHHAIAEGHGDTAVALLKEGADHTLKNSADELALDLAPDREVRRYILQGAEREGIELSG
ncbi:putative ankyrin-repeat protein [Fusarium irregulare]|uniref:Ankyrin-repeat protein n=1 Tax=Fusarium irregulare TaxID=2494466 RepID=A0A9W8PKP6_9HYPO|nr:putative ankyrin-repeat protein [Fusarium irregulare]KAJ4008325.1 putative ankyrin-repeat protein [Fusarium irregulare]